MVNTLEFATGGALEETFPHARIEQLEFKIENNNTVLDLRITIPFLI